MLTVGMLIVLLVCCMLGTSKCSDAPEDLQEVRERAKSHSEGSFARELLSLRRHAGGPLFIFSIGTAPEALDSCSLDPHEFPLHMNVTSFNDLRHLLRGPNIHIAHGYRPYSPYHWSPVNAHGSRASAHHRADSYLPHLSMSKELRQFLLEHEELLANWSRCDKRPLVVGLCPSVGMGNWVRTNIGGFMLSLELGGVFSRDCVSDHLIHLERLWEPRWPGPMDWVRIREKAMEPGSKGPCGHGGCGSRHEVYVEMKHVNAYFGDARGKDGRPLRQSVPADTLRRARTSPTCANIIWQQYPSLEKITFEPLPPIPRHRVQRLLAVPEFRAVLQCSGNRPCNSTLVDLGAVSYNLFTNVAVKPSRDLSAFFVHRVKELGFQAGEQYLVGIQMRLGLEEGLDFLNNLTVAEVCKVSDDVIEDVCVYVVLHWYSLRSSSCRGFGRRHCKCVIGWSAPMAVAR